MQNPRTKKHSRGSDHLLVISIFILIALLGGLVTYLILSHKDTPVTKTQTMNHADMDMDHDTMTAKSLIDATKSYMSSTFNLPIASETGISPAYKPADSPTYVATDTAQTLDLALAAEDESALTAAAAKMTDYLRDEHRLHVMQPVSAEGTVRLFTELQNDLLICTVQPLSGHVTVSCEDKAHYTKLASDIAPFGAALLKSQFATELLSQDVLGKPQIKASETTGYQTATLNQWSYDSHGGNAALFYKTPTNDWQYFTGTQSELICSQYNTAELKNAYAGVQCLTANGQSTVK